MRAALTPGVCVSCGRTSGLLYRSCPYCGESVWAPPGVRAARLALLAFPAPAAALLALAARPDLAAFGHAARSAPAAPAFLLAAALGLLLLPTPDSDLVLTSRAERYRWQALALLGGTLMSLASAAAALCLAFGRTVGPSAWLLALLLAAAVAAAPRYYRIPRRAWAASALLAAALAAL